MTESTKREDEETMETEDNAWFIRALQWLTLKLNLLEKGATPPKWRHILLIFASLFGSSCSLTFLFPFLPEMILHLGYSEFDKGKYGGLIAAAVFAGRIFSSMFWGWLADRRGRKQVITLCLILTGTTAGLFGFSVNITMAIALRFLCGFMNGVVGTCKAALYDCSDNTNQALGMTMLSLAWGSGMVAGPLLGGLLATPCTKWPELCGEDSLFGRFPFLLPSLFPCITCVLVSILVMFTFEETFFASSEEDLVMDGSLLDEKQGKEGLDQNNPPKPKHHHHHLLVQRSHSHNDGNQLRPIHNMFSRSVVSLCPEAEMSVSLGKEVLHKQNCMEQDRKRILELTLSEPDLPMNKGQRFDAVLMNNGDSIFSKSASHIQNDNKIVPKDCNGMHNGSVKSMSGGRAPIYRLNGTNPTHSSDVVCSQPKDVLSIENEIKQNKTDKVSEENINSQPLLPRFTEDKDEDENVCECCDSCFKQCLTNSSLHKMLRLSDIWSSVMLYTVLSFVTIAIDDIFPMFASTPADYGGLGFSTNEIGMSLGFATLPLLFLQVKLYPFLVSKLSIRKTFMVMVAVCLVASQSIPMLRTLVNSPTWLWVCLIAIQVPFKIACNCCFASTSLLINNSAPQELAGQVNGLGMTCTAIGRSIAPIVAGLTFSWSVEHGQFIGAPFDIGFPFFVLGLVYGISLIECLYINPRLDKQKK